MLLIFLTCDTVVAVPLQHIVNCCAEVFILVNCLYFVNVDESISLGWKVFPKINVTIVKPFSIPSRLFDPLSYL